uniref:Uncharacterized protein n=1 Tax=Physcomitrium patens TaxID=3218 RepID=A0A7I4A5X8_PHYPA
MNLQSHELICHVADSDARRTSSVAARSIRKQQHCFERRFPRGPLNLLILQPSEQNWSSYPDAVARVSRVLPGCQLVFLPPATTASLTLLTPFTALGSSPLVPFTFTVSLFSTLFSFLGSLVRNG